MGNNGLDTPEMVAAAVSSEMEVQSELPLVANWPENKDRKLAERASMVLAWQKCREQKPKAPERNDG